MRYILKLNGIKIGDYSTKKEAEKGIRIELAISSLHKIDEYSVHLETEIRQPD